MKNVLIKILNFFLSLRTTIWLLLALLLMLLYGSFAMPLRQEFASINSISLFEWLRWNPSAITWWIYGSIALLSILVANTIICSIESLIKKREGKRWLLIISPQIIHVGFLFMLLAHLLSSSGSFKGTAVAYEGSVLYLPNNIVLQVKSIKIDTGLGGYISDWRTDIEYISNGDKIKDDFLKPNSPSFYRGLGIYLKDIQAYPSKAVLLEVSREPGALWALIGSILFMMGTVMLLLLKIRREG